VPLLTEYRQLLAVVFSLTNSLSASDVGANHYCCEYASCYCHMLLAEFAVCYFTFKITLNFLL